MKSYLLFLVLLLVFAVPAFAKAPSAEVQATYDDIQKTFGFVPSFVKSYPPEGITGAWQELKAVEFSETALSDKLKSLIGLSVAAQVPCKYCVYMDTKGAKISGASEREIREAVAMAAATRHWSTILNGLQTNESDFRDEVRAVFDHFNKMKEKTAKGEAPKTTPIVVTDADSALKDIQQTLGSVPSFFKAMPRLALPGAWKMMKGMQMGADTALNGKEKELIGIALSAQIPCKYCSYFHTEAAKFNGATETEVGEAVVVSSLVRHWSTMLNGLGQDEAAFRREADQILNHMAKQAQPMAEKSAPIKRAKRP